MFFKDFDKLNYRIDGIDHVVTNIITANMLNRWIVDKTYVFRKYQLQSSDSPESVSYDLYGSTDYYWTLYVVNNIVNPFKDWVAMNDIVLQYCKKKYDDPYATHHYMDVIKDIRLDAYDEKQMRKLDPSDYPSFIRPISNYEYELDLNDEKLEIMVIGVEYINKFVDDYKQKLKGIK